MLPTLEAGSIDAVVCDPPYHLTSIVERFGKENSAPVIVPEGGSGVYARSTRGFMGQQWDGGDVAFRPETWREVLRVLKVPLLVLRVQVLRVQVLRVRVQVLRVPLLVLRVLVHPRQNHQNLCLRL